MAKFSIIVPVYNVEKYLHECLRSILGQTYSDYEIILVDDGSTDSSGEICDEYASKYPNVHVYHQENQGLSAARNFGVQNAIGEYIWFVDSDDVILTSDALETLDKNLAGQVDVVVFGWKEASTLDEFQIVREKYNFNTTIDMGKSGKEFLDNSLDEYPFYYWYPWTYLFKREYWLRKKFAFPIGKKFEDIKLTYRAVLEADSVAITKNALYGYRINRKGSITTVANLKSLQDGILVAAENIQEVMSNASIEKDLKMKLSNNFACNYFALLISSTKLNKMEQKEFRTTLKKYRWVADYTTSSRQKLVKVVMSIFGIATVQKVLGIRRVLKHGK